MFGPRLLCSLVDELVQRQQLADKAHLFRCRLTRYQEYFYKKIFDKRKEERRIEMLHRS